MAAAVRADRRAAAQRPASSVSRAALGGVALACALVNLAAFAAALPGILSIAAYLVIHAGTLLVAGGALWRLPPGSAGAGYGKFVWTVSLLTGGVGVAAGLAAWPLFALFRRNSQPFEEWYRSLFPELAAASADLPVGGLDGAADGAPDVESFVDILEHGTPDEKSEMLSLIARRYDPAFLPVLQEALKDDSPAVRVEAAAAFAKLRDRFAFKAAELEKQAHGEPGNPAAHVALARAFDRWAWSGLTDAQQAESLRRRALESWLRCQALERSDEAVHAIGRLLVRLGEYEAAVDWLHGVAAKPDAPADIVRWYMEALFETGRYDALRALARGQTGPGSAAPHRMIAALRDPAAVWTDLPQGREAAHG